MVDVEINGGVDFIKRIKRQRVVHNIFQLQNIPQETNTEKFIGKYIKEEEKTDKTGFEQFLPKNFFIRFNPNLAKALVHTLVLIIAKLKVWNRAF